MTTSAVDWAKLKKTQRVYRLTHMAHARLHAAGFTLRDGDSEQGGVWLSKGGKARWFASLAAAALFVESGSWPWGSGA